MKLVFEDDDKEDGMKLENKDKNLNMNVILGLFFINFNWIKY